MISLDNCNVMRCIDGINLNDSSNTIADLLNYAQEEQRDVYDRYIAMQVPTKSKNAKNKMRYTFRKAELLAALLPAWEEKSIWAEEHARKKGLEKFGIAHEINWFPVQFPYWSELDVSVWNQVSSLLSCICNLLSSLVSMIGEKN